MANGSCPAGAAGCLGDIGTHAFNLVHYLTDLELEEVCAELTSFVKGRRLDDDANVLLRYRGGSRAVLISSQVCLGKENALTIRIYGTKGSLEWDQEAPNQGFIEAFANIYREAARAIRAEVNGDTIPTDCDFPTIDDGVNGMAFVEAAMASAKAGGAWTRMATRS